MNKRKSKAWLFGYGMGKRAAERILEDPEHAEEVRKAMSYAMNPRDEDELMLDSPQEEPPEPWENEPEWLANWPERLPEQTLSFKQMDNIRLACAQYSFQYDCYVSGRTNLLDVRSALHDLAHTVDDPDWEPGR